MEDMQRLIYKVETVGCYTYFSITGDFNTKEIIAKLGMTPYDSIVKGEGRRSGKGVYTFSSLKFGLCKEYDGMVEKQMFETIRPFMDKVEVLKQIKKMGDIEFTLAIVPYVRYDEPTPCLAPSMEVMKFCVETDTNIDIDLYVGCPDGEDGIKLNTK